MQLPTLVSYKKPAVVMEGSRVLDGRGEEHDAARRTEHLGGEVRGELGLDDTRVAVGARDAAPDDADARAVDLTLGLVDVGDALGLVWSLVCGGVGGVGLGIVRGVERRVVDEGFRREENEVLLRRGDERGCLLAARCTTHPGDVGTPHRLNIQHSSPSQSCSPL